MPTVAGHMPTVAARLQGRKKNASASGVTVAGVAGAAAQAQAAAKKEATHTDFYRFQQREQRRSGERPRCLFWLPASKVRQCFDMAH